jgi:D-aspartate ligase
MLPIDVSTPVLVLGFHHGSLGIARSLGRLGISVYGVDANPDAPGLLSRYCSGSRVWNISTAPAAESVAFLRDYAREIGGRPILIATSDDAAIFIAENSDSLAPHFLFPKVPADTVRALCDKKQLYHLCRSLGVPTPHTLFPNNIHELERFASGVTFPVMVKGIDGLKLERRTGKKMVIVHSREELMRTYRELEDPGEPNLMIQEYIPGGDDTIWMFNGYFDRNSNCRAAYTGKKLRQHPVHTGATSLGICLENATVEALTINFMQRIRYRGILDIGWRYDARDGSYKLLDPNPRIGATFRLFVGSDNMDVARFLYLDMTAQPLPISLQREGRKWWIEDRDFESTLDYMREGSLNLGAWARSFRGVEEAAWFAKDDWKPFLRMMRATTLRALAKLFRVSAGKKPPARRDNHQEKAPPAASNRKRPHLAMRA